ncbi:molybdopterin converting factor subunit 1 [Aureimonas pseudogalii]|uniref:Molybdopterin synthase sulfur carrier subunit n=1 Tax=Aureimonas pseudogalii TaxID=1744844 RepID=A0A7W6EHH6_9HYPH|nr:molybdopterin converting factor subunit 1 [Aureimonas pseudogalii]MBB3998578.1 molybdopterin synthase sulfur carrier subunit [Aureimonas pseudogalii]
MKIVYFAWVRERVGIPEEEVALPAGLVTVSDLLHWLKGRGENYDAALQAPEIVRVALDQEHVEHSQPIGDCREVAIFPPMTGG